MKIRTTKYIVKEGMINTYRNKIMSLASIGIVTASIVIFGLFLLVAYTLNLNTKALKEQPEIQAFCDRKLDDTQVAQVENEIKKIELIRTYTVKSRAEAFKEIKEMLGDKKNLVKGYDESFAPVSFIIKLKNPKDSPKVVEMLGNIMGIEKVNYPKAVIESISKIVYWVQFISIFLIILLLMVSMFIISNTIKLTVFARRKEINIMKYIGATDWFIRWPFIIEGVVIGFIGAVAAFIAVALTYNAIENKLSSDFANLITLVSLRNIGLQMILIYVVIGSVIGAVGSLISIRKYLHV